MNVYGVNQYRNYLSYTLCWDCKNATGNCSWSRDLIPVEGWVATPTINRSQSSYLVFECPEFDRDAEKGGIKRYNKEGINGKSE